jgi:hypothetical protein
LDPNRLSQGQLVAALAAIALFIISFLPWFGISDALQVQGTTIDESYSIWEAPGNTFDFFLLILVLVAVVPPALALLGGGGEGGPLAPIATALLGGVGTLMIIFMLFDPPADFDRKVGLFLGLIACAAVAVGGYLSMQEEAGVERY